MTIGPNEDGAELYREHLESMPCPKCGGLLLTQSRGKSAKCLKCQHSLKLEEQDAVPDGTPAQEH